jgi:hypothetical protein
MGETAKGSAVCAADTDENVLYITVLPAEKANLGVVDSSLTYGATNGPGGAVLPDLIAVQQELFGFAFGAGDLQSGFLQISPDGNGFTAALFADNRLHFQRGNPGKSSKILPDIIRMISNPKTTGFINHDACSFWKDRPSHSGRPELF